MYQLNIERCMRDEADELSDLLSEMGAVSVTLTDRFDSPILEPEIGTTPLWADVVLQALYEDEQDAIHVRRYLADSYSHLIVDLKTVPEQDWVRVCVADFKPQQFGKRLWICPSWLTPPDENAINLILDPGLAFGTGTHPTTALCLTWLEQAELTSKRVIDYGCGSGILALAALKLGASYVDAVDLDEQALIATRNNAANNQINTALLSVDYPSALREPVDLIIANILLMPLQQLQGEFRQLLKPEGLLVVSGILNEQAELLIATYQQTFIPQATFSEGDWCLVVFKPQTS